ncbi:Uncharacterized protein M6B38_243075 [Iris pallida]|nr:Uncharacterized protein M6B38_243075 [Iris pallida]
MPFAPGELFSRPLSRPFLTSSFALQLNSPHGVSSSPINGSPFFVEVGTLGGLSSLASSIHSPPGLVLLSFGGSSYGDGLSSEYPRSPLLSPPPGRLKVPYPRPHMCLSPPVGPMLMRRPPLSIPI